LDGAPSLGLKELLLNEGTGGTLEARGRLAWESDHAGGGEGGGAEGNRSTPRTEVHGMGPLLNEDLLLLRPSRRLCPMDLNGCG
jgi:hypothetical protein